MYSVGYLKLKMRSIFPCRLPGMTSLVEPAAPAITVYPADSRQVIVSLTEAGLMEIRRKREEIIQAAMQILEELGPEDAKALLRIQEKLARSSLRQTQALAPPDTTKKRREPSR